MDVHMCLCCGYTSLLLTARVASVCVHGARPMCLCSLVCKSVHGVRIFMCACVCMCLACMCARSAQHRRQEGSYVQWPTGALLIFFAHVSVSVVLEVHTQVVKAG